MKQKIKLGIYVAEDNLLNQHLIAKVLESVNSTIRFFATGEDCVKAVKELMPDILILDYNLEGKLTGLETLKKVRSINSEIFAIIFSTEPGLESKENFSHYGEFVYIEKNETGFSELEDSIRSSQAFKKSQLLQR